MSASFGARLLRWYDRERRDLPWRRATDPWAIWVSEVMLQQTRVEAVVTAFERFVERFPTPAAFAAASDDELLEAWRGLGYYRRARMLRDGAADVVARHGGRVPADPAALRRLRGVGEYTAGAVSSIAFDRPVPAIDGNVERVLARHRGLREVVKSTAARRALRAAVGEEIDHRRPGDFNQALMELGATVCTPRRALCDRCPVAADCVAAATATVDELPLLPPRPAPRAVHARAALVVRADGAILGARIPAGQVNEGQIELPGPGLLAEVADARALELALRTRFATTFRVGAELVFVRHTITRHRITLVVHDAALAAKPGGGLCWYSAGDARAPWSTASRKALAAHARRDLATPPDPR